jgi:LCP family protein required for cell wall assembly
MMLLTATLVCGAGAWGIVRAADDRADDVERVEGLESVLAVLPGSEGSVDARTQTSAVDTDGDGEVDSTVVVGGPGDDAPAIVNYLLVGSDSREGVSSTDEDFAIVGDTSDVGGRRADAIMILHQDAAGDLSLVSLPRDLWLPISGTGTSNRINSAFNEGAERLAATVTESLGVPIHHYVEVDFIGFKDIIDAVGGVELCVGWAARDTKSGLRLDVGCQNLDGVMALAFARSRNYEEWDGSRWVIDPRADLGRIERQQLFMRAAIDGTIRRVRSSPFGSGDLIGAVVESLRIDERLDPFDAADTLRDAAEEDGLRTFKLSVYATTESNQSVLKLSADSTAVLQYLQGTGPVPTEFETTAATE